MAPENPDPAWPADRRHRASMGPEPGGSGKHRGTLSAQKCRCCFNGAGSNRLRKTGARRHRDPLQGLASMEPEPIGSGKHHVKNSVVLDTWPLQWGRSQSAPENIVEGADVLKTAMLQWGRSRLAPENPTPRLFGSTRTRSFNGAGAA